jgi:hypothetical protein
LDIEARTLASNTTIGLDWQGLPGRGLGGLLSQLNTDRGMPPYRIEIGPGDQSKFVGVGVPAAGTKCLYGSWTDSLTLVASSSLREISGVDQLEGELVNPLPVDLLEPVLFYHNWYYGLDSRIPSGGTVPISFDTIPKDISRRLNLRRTVDGNERITKWDPAERNSVDRLLELMMFHKAAAGRTYTSLTHRYQPQVDQSNLLKTDQAILVGRLEVPWVEIDVTPPAALQSRSSLEVQQDMRRVWCRIAIPVEQNFNH